MRLSLPLLVIGCTAIAVTLTSAWEFPESDIIFSHANHVGQRSLGCSLCHDGVEGSLTSSDKNLPVMERCFICHNGNTAPANCDLCHRDAANPQASPNPPRTINFPHRTHLRQGLACGKCHRGVEKASTMTGEQYPDMKVCIECHDGETVTMNCTVCHTETGVVIRNSHEEGWIHRHKFLAMHEPSSCRLCHEGDQTCAECHFGDNLQQTSHSINYEFEHPLDAKGKERDCMACHDENRFCAPCHLENRVMPPDHSRADWPQHAHAVAVKKDMEACLACHQVDNSTCLRCHMDRDGVLGTDPKYHPPDLGRDDRGPWHDDPGELCFDCHVYTPGQGFCTYCHGPGRGGGYELLR